MKCEPLHVPGEFPVHKAAEDPEFFDTYHDVELDAHEHRIRRDRDLADPELAFKCRLRRWVFSDDPDKPTLFMIAGIAHSCNFFNPMVKCMTVHEDLKDRIGRVYAFDLPGHGASSSPRNIKFGMLNLADYISTIVQLMDVVKKEAGKIDYVVAHSMGGMLAQLVEKTLISFDEPSALSRYGTEGLVLLASAIPEQVRWSFGEGKVIRFGVPFTMLKVLLPYVTFSPHYFMHGRQSNDDFLHQYFAVYSEHLPEGKVVPGAPTGDTVSIINSAESYTALAELGGLDIATPGTIKRPFIPEGMFSRYKLGISGYTKDILFLPEEEEELCAYLSKDASRSIFRCIDHDYAVHDDPYTWPCPSVELVRDVMNLPGA